MPDPETKLLDLKGFPYLFELGRSHHQLLHNRNRKLSICNSKSEKPIP